MLGVGIDRAGSFQDVALGVPGRGVTAQFRIDHGPADVQQLIACCLEPEPDPAEVRVVLVTRHGLLAGARGPAKKKDDSEDARICALMDLDACLDLRKLIPHGEAGTELRAIARDDERAARDERRADIRPRAGLLTVFPRRHRHRRRRPERASFPEDAGAPAIRAQRRPRERRMGELPLGAPRYGRVRCPVDPG